MIATAIAIVLENVQAFSMGAVGFVGVLFGWMTGRGSAKRKLAEAERDHAQHERDMAMTVAEITKEAARDTKDALIDRISRPE